MCFIKNNNPICSELYKEMQVDGYKVSKNSKKIESFLKNINLEQNTEDSQKICECVVSKIDPRKLWFWNTRLKNIYNLALSHLFNLYHSEQAEKDPINYFIDNLERYRNDASSENENRVYVSLQRLGKLTQNDLNLLEGTHFVTLAQCGLLDFLISSVPKYERWDFLYKLKNENFNEFVKIVVMYGIPICENLPDPDFYRKMTEAASAISDVKKRKAFICRLIKYAIREEKLDIIRPMQVELRKKYNFFSRWIQHVRIFIVKVKLINKKCSHLRDMLVGCTSHTTDDVARQVLKVIGKSQALFEIYKITNNFTQTKDAMRFISFPEVSGKKKCDLDSRECEHLLIKALNKIFEEKDRIWIEKILYYLKKFYKIESINFPGHSYEQHQMFSVFQKTAEKLNIRIIEYELP